jgi:hypothetical protein
MPRGPVPSWFLYDSPIIAHSPPIATKKCEPVSKRVESVLLACYWPQGAGQRRERVDRNFAHQPQPHDTFSGLGAHAYSQITQGCLYLVGVDGL